MSREPLLKPLGGKEGRARNDPDLNNFLLSWQPAKNQKLKNMSPNSRNQFKNQALTWKPKSKRIAKSKKSNLRTKYYLSKSKRSNKRTIFYLSKAGDFSVVVASRQEARRDSGVRGFWPENLDSLKNFEWLRLLGKYYFFFQCHKQYLYL